MEHAGIKSGLDNLWSECLQGIQQKKLLCGPLRLLNSRTEQPEEEAQREGEEASKPDSLVLQLRAGAGSSYRYTDQPQHHSCGICFPDPRCLLQGCSSLIQYSADRLNLGRATALLVPVVRIWLLTRVRARLHPAEMRIVSSSSSRMVSVILTLKSRLDLTARWLAQAHTFWTWRAPGSPAPPDPHQAKLTP